MGKQTTKEQFEELKEQLEDLRDFVQDINTRVNTRIDKAQDACNDLDGRIKKLDKQIRSKAKAREQITYRIGDRFTHAGEGDIYVICGTANSAALVNLSTTNRGRICANNWQEMPDSDNITLTEFWYLACGNPEDFKLIIED